MSQTNSAAALQQQNQQQQPTQIQNQQSQQFQTSADNLISNAFDLIGGVSAAQQFINHMDLYAQHQRQLQQQQEQQQQQQAQQQLNNYTYQQQQQRLFLNSIGESTLSTSTSISSSSGSQSPPSHLIQQQQQQQYQQQYHHHQQQQQQQYHQQQQQQQQPRQHSISLTSSRNVSPTNFNTQLQQQHHQQFQQYYKMSHNLINNQNHQMDIDQQQQQQQLQQLQQNGTTTTTSTAVQLAGIDATTTNVKTTSTAAPAVSVVVTSTDSAASLTNANNGTTTTTNTSGHHHQQQQQQQQHHHHQHQHHQHGGDASPYKSCWCYGETTYHMKILVPAVASGAIIGKGGETIASLQKDSGARVKMSKSHDFYPGTTERVCLITGSVDGIMSVVDFIMDKIREKPDLTAKVMDGETKQQQERDKQVKILVPNSTAGMIIGKGGAYIKQIKEESGSYVQISQKPKDISLQERCITIIGDKENNKNACKMILSKIVEDPQSGTCLNVSYADVNGPVANFNPTGSPYATNQNAINTSTASLNSTLSSAISGAATAHGLLVNGTGVNLSLNLGAPNPAPNLALATQLLEHIKVALRGSGYSETATTEVCAALGVLAKYGVLGMGVGMPHTANGAHAALSSYLGVSALDQQSAAAATAASAANVFGPVGQVNLEQYTAAMAAAANRQSQSLDAAAVAQFDPFRLSSATAQASTPVSLNNNSFGLTAATGASGGAGAQALVATSVSSLGGLSKSPTPGDMGAKDQKNVEINENIIGALLGPNGRSLVEIQHVSGANVQISKKGIFAPGTRNRIVTITGQPSAIAKAQFLIEQKINEEETKRARQIPHTTVVN